MRGWALSAVMAAFMGCGTPLAQKEPPKGWTTETKTVKVATPTGDQERQITYYTNSIGMKLVRIPAGEFMMGDTLTPEQVDQKWPGGKIEWYKDAHPRHRVRLTKDFYIGAHEVTCGQFAQFVNAGGYKTEAEKGGGSFALKQGRSGIYPEANWRNPLFEQTDDHPVVCVSWNDAKAFCDWLSKKEGKEYRLPTEAEWEYAARGGSETAWYWGDDESGAQGRANVADEGADLPHPLRFKGVRDGYKYTAPVGTFAPNALGLYDVIGNVWESCENWFDENYYGASPSDDPTGPQTGQEGVVRGGAWYDFPGFTRSAFRLGYGPAGRCSYFGFRVVCSVR
jgi:formylglycine-generating enzyme required for sulfatase activity